MVSVVRTESSKCPRRESACPRQSVLAGSTERSSPRSETRTNETMRIPRRNQSKSPTDHDNDGQTNRAERLSRSEAGARRPAAALKWHAAGASKARISSIGGRRGAGPTPHAVRGPLLAGRVFAVGHASAGWGGWVTAASTLALVMSAARETDQRVPGSVSESMCQAWACTFLSQICPPAGGKWWWWHIVMAPVEMSH